MKLTIAGLGVVGRAHKNLLKDYYTLQIVDPKFSTDLIDPDTSGVIVCVPTPTDSTGACDMQHVYDVLNCVNWLTPVLIKSTISLEGWRELCVRYPDHCITFSPEYLRADTADQDLADTKVFDFSKTGVYEFWASVLEQTIWGGSGSSRFAEPEALILAKYFRNSFLATKVAFFNQIYDLCEATGIDYQTVSRHIGNDERIGHSHTQVTVDRGYGGACFPKDTRAILATAQHHNVKLSILQQVVDYNKQIRDI